MRTRDRDEDWIEELGRRRLEALIAELTPSTGAPVADDAQERADLSTSGDRVASGLARGLRFSHALFDGDTVFAAATGHTVTRIDFTKLGAG